MNISDNSAFRACTSCGACATVCAKKAIMMKLDEEGFYRPEIDAKLCNDCGLCTTVCYKFDDDVHMTSDEDLERKSLFAAWANDDDAIRNSTSGGFGDLLARQLLKDGYKVVGVAYNYEKERAEHQIADTDEQLYAFRGSKYIQSYTFDAFKEIVANCRSEKYAVFGTPCQIYALNRMATQRKVRDHFFFVDLYCHGCPSLNVWTKYQADIKKRVGVNKIDSVSFRSKIRGWGNFYVVVVVVDGKPVFISSKANDKFYELFFSDQILNSACGDCKLRSTMEYTDLRLGDFWGKKYLDNHRGVSAVAVATPMGGGIFTTLKPQIHTELCSWHELHPWQSWGRAYQVNESLRSKILASLNNSQEDINDAVKALRHGQPASANIKRIIKTVVAYFPIGLLSWMRKIKYKLQA